MRNHAKDFRTLFEKPGLLLRPCAYDCLSAKLIEQAGFPSMGTSGYAISASRIGQPDIGLLSFGEMLEACRAIIQAVNIPVDVDADTGYGGPHHVYWTTKNFIWANAGGIRIEDQDVENKRCGHMAGGGVISTEEMVEKIHAAMKARDEEGSDLVIGARTDAKRIEGTVIRRVEAYTAAGADYVYVECPSSLDEIKTLVTAAGDVPLAFNMIQGGKTPIFPLDTLEDLGVKYISIPMICLYPATMAMQSALYALQYGLSLEYIKEDGVSWQEFNDLIGKPEWERRGWT